MKFGTYPSSNRTADDDDEYDDDDDDGGVNDDIAWRIIFRYRMGSISVYIYNTKSCTRSNVVIIMIE